MTMFASLPVALQAYFLALFVGLCVPVFVFWILQGPLRNFLEAIFANDAIERFWLRLVLLVILLNTFSAAVGYEPDKRVGEDFVVLVWNLADQIQSILQSLIAALFMLFIPLLLSYTILHVGRPPDQMPNDNSEDL